MNLIDGFVCRHSKKIIHVDSLYEAGKHPDENKRISEESIDDCLKRLVSKKYLGCLKDEYYLSWRNYLSSKEWQFEAEAEARELGLI